MDRNHIISLILLTSFCLTLFATNRNSTEPTNFPYCEKADTIETSDRFPIRGFHVDLRIQVMTMPALKSFAKELADFGINTLIMEWEASFPYKKHATISNKYAYSREEVKEFVNYCNNLGIDVIPLQQCFGHVEYILRHPRYSELRESNKEISQICPLKTEGDSLLFSDLFADMVSLHNSKYLHIGGDETYLLGHCSECSEKAANKGKSKLFVDYMKMICELCLELGKTPVMWADILLEHPEAAAELPKETIFVDWNYGWEINRFGDIEKLLDQGLTFWGAPALRSNPDNWYTTDWQKHFNNQRDFIPYARAAGYQGMIMTSWSTSGLYGFNWDTNDQVIDMYAIRNVYPLSGFRILIASYAQALNQTKPLNSKLFVVQYAQNRFGLTAIEGEKLWEIINASPETINLDYNADVEKLDQIIQSVNQAQELINTLTPKENKKEFEHLKLMLDFRSFYLDFKKVESIYESDQYDRDMAKEILPQLKLLLNQSKTLDERFTKLNNGYLYPQEIEEQNQIRNKKLNNIYEAVANLTGK